MVWVSLRTSHALFFSLSLSLSLSHSQHLTPHTHTHSLSLAATPEKEMAVPLHASDSVRRSLMQTACGAGGWDVSGGEIEVLDAGPSLSSTARKLGEEICWGE